MLCNKYIKKYDYSQTIRYSIDIRCRIFVRRFKSLPDGIYIIMLMIHRAVIASIASVICRSIFNSSSDTLWKQLPIFLLHGIEVIIGLIITCTPHFVKIVRSYEVSFSAGSGIAFYLCCRCVSRKGTKTREAARNKKRSGTFGPPRVKKNSNLYPDLDVSGGTTTTGEVQTDKPDKDAQLMA